MLDIKTKFKLSRNKIEFIFIDILICNLFTKVYATYHLSGPDFRKKRRDAHPVPTVPTNLIKNRKSFSS